MFQFVLNFLFPKYCLSCRAPGCYICSSCSSRLRPATALANPEILACFDYDHQIIKQAVWKLKYSGLTSLAGELANLMAKQLAEEVSELAAYTSRQKILTVPVPMSQQRRRHRGYNQAAMLARALTAAYPDTLEYDGQALVKIKETPPQVNSESRSVRLTNLRGAFTVHRPATIAGRLILVIDDVVTTGATLAEARRALLAAGAGTVLGVALAHRE